MYIYLYFLYVYAHALIYFSEFTKNRWPFPRLEFILNEMVILVLFFFFNCSRTLLLLLFPKIYNCKYCNIVNSLLEKKNGQINIE